MIGSGKKFVEKSAFKRLAYSIFGEIHIPGRIRIKQTLREIEALGFSADKKVKILDVGCAKGDLDFVLASRYPNWHVTGVELDKVKYRDACIIKEKLGLDNVTILNENLLNAKGSEEYDIIVCSDVLEQIEDDDSAVKKFHGLLKKGGYLVLTTPSIPQRKHLSLVKWREKKMGLNMDYYGHIRKGYSQKDIYEKLSHFNFSKLAHRYTYGFFGTLAFDIFFVIGDSNPNPILFAIFFPVLLVLGFLDTHVSISSGSALVIRACKV